MNDLNIPIESLSLLVLSIANHVQNPNSVKPDYSEKTITTDGVICSVNIKSLIHYDNLYPYEKKDLDLTHTVHFLFVGTSGIHCCATIFEEGQSIYSHDLPAESWNDTSYTRDYPPDIVETYLLHFNELLKKTLRQKMDYTLNIDSSYKFNLQTNGRLFTHVTVVENYFGEHTRTAVKSVKPSE